MYPESYTPSCCRGEAQSDSCGRMDAMFSWIIYRLTDGLQFVGLQSGVLDTLQSSTEAPQK